MLAKNTNTPHVHRLIILVIGRYWGHMAEKLVDDLVIIDEVWSMQPGSHLKVDTVRVRIQIRLTLSVAPLP